MPKSMTGLMILVTSSLLVFSLGAQERDDSRLKPAERNRAGTLRQLIPGYYVFSSTSFNSGVIATSEGVVVLDALSSEAIARQEREAIASVINSRFAFWFPRLSTTTIPGATLPTRTLSRWAMKTTGPISSLKCNGIVSRRKIRKPGSPK